MRFWLPIVLVCTLSACSGSVKQLAQLEPAGEDFDSALAAEYLGYATSESEQQRYFTAEHFAQKGLDAHGKNLVLPDEVGGRLAEPKRSELMQARQSLVSVLTQDVKNAAPQVAARTQMLFDCWLEQSKSAPKSASTCGDEFTSSFLSLQAVADEFILAEPATVEVLFSSGSANLSAAGVAKVREVAKRVKSYATYAIELEGHAINKGSRSQYSALAARRVAVVRKALMNAGVSADHIYTKEWCSGTEVYLSIDEAMQNNNRVDMNVKTQNLIREKTK